MKHGFIAEGTTCESCEKIIKRQAKKVKGVKSVEFDYETETGYVEFDNKTNMDEILDKIEEKGYTCYLLDESKSKNNSKKTIGWIIAIIGIIIAGYFILQLSEKIPMPEITAQTSYTLLFVVGLLTGFHCVSMCGGFVISYTTKAVKNKTSVPKAHAKYAVGKLISYTVIGAIFGLVGSIITFTPMMRGVAGVIAGLFLIIFGINMLNLIPALRKIRIPMPKVLSKFVGTEQKKHNSPLIIGLLNGLMIACGPLQAIYIMAAATGSMFEGAKLLFIFALGTLPIMLGFGFLTSFLSSKATNKILKASGTLVIILGIIMLNRGLALTGLGIDANSISIASSASASDDNIVMEDGFQVIEMEVNRYGWEPDKFVLKRGVPVRWKIDGKELNGCNNAIVAPKLGLDFKIKEGPQVIEFTPDKEGKITWSCWMGMIPGMFVVQEDMAGAAETLENIPDQPAGSCGGGSGCGCGG
jgi:uncharacterized protein